MADERLAFWDPGLEPAERARRMVEATKIIASLPSETYRRDMDIYNVRLYENSTNTTLYNFAGKYYSDVSAGQLPITEQSQNNKAKAVIDTFASLVFSTNQRARMKSTQADYKQRRRARELQNFADGLADEVKLHKKRKRMGLDACILESGVGVLVWFARDGRADCERALATEFAINPLDGFINGLPRVLYRHRPMSVDQAKADFGGEPELDALIDAAPKVSSVGAPGEFIEVFEGWSLPSSMDDDNEDGWHIIGVDAQGSALVVEEHKRQLHDAVFYCVEDRFTGAWGLSFLTQIRSLQCNINARTARALRTEKLFHAAHLYVDRAAQMAKSKLTNEIGTVWEGNGPQPPQAIQYQGLTAEMNSLNDRDATLMFQNLGIPLGQAHGTTDLGANAPAAAMREETKKGDDRNSVRQQGWEDNHLDNMRVALAIVRDLIAADEGKTETVGGKRQKKKSSYKVAAPGRRGGLTVIDWTDVKMDEDAYVLEVKAASPVPTDPDGLIAYGERMVEIGAWTPQKLASMMQDLDADGRTSRMLSAERNLEQTFESLLYDDIAAALPDEFTNVKLAMEIGTEYLEQGKEDEVPEKHLERVRRYLRRCKQMATAAQAAAAPPPAAPGAPVGAAPPALQAVA